MDHYEELGIPANASAEDIHRAYKNLARLFHPDCQNDPELRRLGDIQMKRLNSILTELLDARERRRYDTRLEMIREVHPRPEMRAAVPRPSPHPLSLKELWSSSRLSLFIWAAAALILVATMTLYFREGIMPLVNPGERVTSEPGAAADLGEDSAPPEKRVKTPPRGEGQPQPAAAPAPESPKDPSAQDPSAQGPSAQDPLAQDASAQDASAPNPRK